MGSVESVEENGEAEPALFRFSGVFVETVASLLDVLMPEAVAAARACEVAQVDAGRDAHVVEEPKGPFDDGGERAERTAGIAAALEHDATIEAGSAGEFGQQARLAAPRGAFDEHEPFPTALCVAMKLGQLIELRFASNANGTGQRAAVGSGSHGGGTGGAESLALKIGGGRDLIKRPPRKWQYVTHVGSLQQQPFP